MPQLSPRDADAFCVQFAPRAPGHPAVRKLYALLCELPSQESSLEARLEGLERLARWLKDPRGVAGLEGSAPPPDVAKRATRLELLLQVLEATPPVRESLGRLVHGVTAETTGLKLFAQVGLPARQGFFSEALERLARHVLPHPPDAPQLAEVLLRLFPTPDSVAWLDAASPAHLAQLFALVGQTSSPDSSAALNMRRDLLDALTLLSIQAASLGLSEEVRDRCPEQAFRASPFLRLRRTTDSLIARDGAPDGMRELTAVLGECRKVLALVSSHLDEFGVSLALIYRLEHLSLTLDRMEDIGRVLAAARGEERWKESLGLLATLLRGAQAHRSTRALLHESLRQLARKVIERAGQSGERYIATSRREYHALVHSAAGGGLLTAFTAAWQLLILGLALPPFFTGLFSAANLAGSFLLMQALGLTLATKQPSMMAATLASAVGEGCGGRLERLVELIPRLTRSQVAVTFANLSCVVPAAVGLAQAFQSALHHPLLPTEQAEAVVASLHLWRSPTLPLAALTGVWLWVSSIAAGWLENWVVYRRLPEAVAHHRAVQRLLGPERAARLAALLLRHTAGVGGCLTLGILLGMTPVVGHVFGLPLDFRHVTLSFGALALAGWTLGPLAVTEPAFLAALGGVAASGALNFGVSFGLALAVALRARDVPAGDELQLVRGVASRLLRSPGHFFFPLEDDEAELAAPPPGLLDTDTRTALLADPPPGDETRPSDATST